MSDHSTKPIKPNRVSPNSMPVDLSVEGTQRMGESSHPQLYHAAVTVESLDAEGLGTIDPETSEELLYTFDPTHDHTHGKSVLPKAAAILPRTDEVPALTMPNRDESVAYAKSREDSRLGKRWWKRPSPYWLLVIQLGSALSMGMGIAPKTEIFNHLACIVHYPYASDFPTTPPVQSNPVIPSPPMPSPSQPDEVVSSSFDQTSFALTRISIRGLFDFSIDPKENTKGGLGSEGQPERSVDPLLCRKSPVVQAAAAKFTTSMSIFQGVLAALTTGWWGRLSDKWGRTRILSIAMVGIIFNDIVFIVTARYPTSVPGGYRFLFIGPIFDGLLGGMPTLSATNQAYVADCTPDGTRAQIFSRLVGVMMVGFALGPIVGAAIIRYSSDVLSVFYVACALHIFTLFIVLFILPESLSTGAKDSLAKMARVREHEIQNQEELERRWEEEEEEDDVLAGNSGWSRLSGVVQTRAAKRSRGVIRRLVKRVFGFLSPLAIFLPVVDENDPKGRKNWNLTFVAMGLSFLMFMMGVLSVKFQYTQLMFGWGPAELSPLLTVIGSLRGANLLIFLPLTVRYFKPKHNGKRPEQFSLSDKISDSRFDLKLIQVSLMLDIIAYFGIILFSGPRFFIASTMLSTLGGGAGPALNSLALSLLPSSRIAGRLFGATSVLSAIVSTVAAPLLFGITYAYTTRVFPKAIFVLSATTLSLALFSLSMIRLDRPLPPLEDAPTEPLLAEPREEERGRPRTPKSVNGRSDISLSTQ
ncbi:Predicted transporter ADD1 (major facilitator superfamily) [Phaffia rhodozyma]|uniref:Predicted transporter ADD1 (Major facilitator superfamily) n=1 Tax=Phaffia rhodozyma TaxID=264483 RepID=A0A0F7SJJ8_PHARH|nr:Predicted transporter ADD1 (major facilitator superfamily) [Phaffia rhodozyma]